MSKNNMYDEERVNDLQLYVENNSKIYEKDLEPIYKNLAKKQAKSSYEPEKAQVFYYRVANKGANMYQKEIEPKYFSPNDKKEVARRLEENNRDELKEYL